MKDGDSPSSEATLADLVMQLQSAAGTQDPEERIAAIGDIQDTGIAHFSALVVQYVGGAVENYGAREALWESLSRFQSRLTRELCAAAEAAPTAASAARALFAIRALVKLHYIHYASVPGKLWRAAYALHASAEKRGFATTPVHISEHRAMTTVERELLRLLMLRMGAPDMMAPEQIELADRAVDQVGSEFTLRQPGVADNPFCYEPANEFGPRRAKDRELPASARYFGPGMGYGSLERITRELGSRALEHFRPFGKDLPPLAQLNTVQHLLRFWREDSPYSPPLHSPVSGSLQVVHGYGWVWQYLSEGGRGTRELSIADTSTALLQPPEIWELRSEGGGELGAAVPAQSRAWAKCGVLVGLSMRDGERWVGLIRRMYDGPDGKLQAGFALLSLDPQAHALREVLEDDDESGFTDASSRQFGMSRVNAVILADGTDRGQPANLLLPEQRWKPGRAYELEEGDTGRFLRSAQVIRHGVDFVRTTFEWVSAPKE